MKTFKITDIEADDFKSTGVYNVLAVGGSLGYQLLVVDDKGSFRWIYTDKCKAAEEK